MVSFTLSSLVSAHSWEMVGSTASGANLICFRVTSQHHVFCRGNCFYLFNYLNNTCEYFCWNNKAVVGAAPFQQGKIQLAMRNGAMEDGIYSFDLETHEYVLLKEFDYPEFLHIQQSDSSLWVASVFGGMIHSPDGENWEDIPFFDTIQSLNMVSYGQNLMITSGINWANLLCYSLDGGETWFLNQPPGFYYFPDICFDSQGSLFAVYPFYEWSSGFYKSEDMGISWLQLGYYSGLKTICVDQYREIYIGWDNEIAHWHFSYPNPNLHFITAGLPEEAEILKIQTDPLSTIPALYVCTDKGVFVSYDYYVGMDDFQNGKPNAVITPNPANDFVEIACDAPISMITVFTLSGKKVMEKPSSETQKILDISGLSQGVYLVKIETSEGNTTQKLVVK